MIGALRRVVFLVGVSCFFITGAGAEENMGTKLKAAVCGDGISPANFEKQSYEQWKKQAGNENKSIQEWRNAVVKALSDASTKDKLYEGGSVTSDQAKRFHEVGDLLGGKKAGQAAWTDTKQFDDLMNGRVKGFTEYGKLDAKGNWHDSYYGTYRKPMFRYLKEKGLMDQAYWQHETKASFVNNGKRQYADPTEVPYLVSNAAPVGSFVKITAPNGKSTYARVLESGTEKAETSLKGWWNLGYPNTTTAANPVNYLEVTPLGSGAFPKGAKSVDQYYMSNDEIQRAGKLLEEGKAKNIVTRQDLFEAERKLAPKQASADPAAAEGGGGNKLVHGFPTVAIGSNMRLVGYACEECIHDGGGYVKEGSSTVYVGKYPFARIADATNDGLSVVTGDETVFIGGTPTSATLA
jgi:uncharacterized Zn-binding protein involved in type VI secretion